MLFADAASSAAPTVIQHSADASMVIVVGGATVLLSLATQVFTMFYTRREAEAARSAMEKRIDAIDKLVQQFQREETGKAHIEGRIAELETKLEHFQEVSSESRRVLYQHVDQVRESLSRKADENYRDIIAQLSRMPAAVIAMLKDTGSLGR